MNALPLPRIVDAATEALGLPSDGATGEIVSHEKRRGQKSLAFVQLVIPGPQRGASRVPLVAKTYPGADAGRRVYDLLTRLRDEGWSGASPHRVVRPVAWLDEERILLMERVAGRTVKDCLALPTGARALEGAGAWLARLHAVPPARRPRDLPALDMDRAPRLVEAMRARFADTADGLHALLPTLRAAPPASEDCLLHGDFHAENLYLGEDGSLTAIDFDHAAHGDPARDVAYAMAQLEAPALVRPELAPSVQEASDRFLRAYEAARGHALPPASLAWHRAFTLLEILHYKCLMRDRRLTGPEGRGLRASFLAEAARSLAEGGHRDR